MDSRYVMPKYLIYENNTFYHSKSSGSIVVYEISDKLKSDHIKKKAINCAINKMTCLGFHSKCRKHIAYYNFCHINGRIELRRNLKIKKKLSEPKKIVQVSPKDKYLNANPELKRFEISASSIFAIPFVNIFNWNKKKHPNSMIKVIVYPKDGSYATKLVVYNLINLASYDAVYERLFVKDREKIKFNISIHQGSPDELFEDEPDPSFINKCTEIVLGEDYENVLKNM